MHKDRMTALIEGFPYDWQIDIIQKCNLIPVYWISNDVGNKSLLPKNAVYHNSLDAIQNIPPKEIKNIKFKYLDDKFFRENINFVDIVIKMYYIRFDLYNKDFLKQYNNVRKFFYKQVAFWNYVLDFYKIDLVLLESIPHLPHHYIIYYLAKVKGLKIIFINRIGEPTRFFLCESMEDLTPDNIVSNLTATDKIVSINTPPKYNIRTERSLINTLKNINFRFKQLKNEHSSLLMIINHSIKRIRYEAIQINNRIKKYSYLKEYNRYSLKKIPDIKFIYFPLHEQPEDSSYPIGKNFEDQIYAIEYLAELLPEDMIILVKEHPNQQYHRGRHPSYYNDIIKIDKVKLIDIKISSFELIKKCKCVATLTGQAGWEALTNGKYVITFAHPWYNECPFVFNIDEIKKNPLILTKDHNIDFNKINEFYNKLINTTYDGYLNTICMPSSRLTREENILKVSEAINFKINSFYK